ncbi:tetraspanin-6-like isoform X1 [Oreochromis aureus]|uniref:tetraspanin-6-like isoform X1 n=1 Tax=Oreochromis aureus TaxID=47969 RepID=UPI001952AAAF|nr:tetraspanin-6-like isoform X1 [Oreochromis aureus]
MGRANVWLKRAFIFVISLIAIISLLLLGFSLFSHGHLHQQEEAEREIAAIHIMYVIAVVIILLTIFGAIGVWKEKQWALIVYAVGMILSSLVMLVLNIQGLASQSQVREELKKQYLNLLPLVNSTEVLDDIQTEVCKTLQCCGLESYQDWKFNIPNSCLCANKSTNPCVAAPRNSSLFNSQKGDGPIMIYEKGCLPYFIETIMSVIRTVLGVTMGIMLLWILSAVLCIAILCQLDRKKDTPAVVYSAEAKAGNYTTLTEVSDHS